MRRKIITINKKQLSMGIKVEMEHTTNPRLAKKIALDHLQEFPGKPYYSELRKMELKLKRMKGGRKK